MKTLASFLLIICIPLISFSQIKEFYWHTTLCNHFGEYDSTKISENQLKGTLALFDMRIPFYLRMKGAAQPWSLNWSNHYRCRLRKAYLSEKKFIRELEIINNTYWQQVREYVLLQLKISYEAMLKQHKGYKHPARLKKYYPEAFPCFEYIDPIISGGTNLLKAWKELESRRCATHEDSVKCLNERYYQKLSSRRKYQYAKSSLFHFGWGYCYYLYLNHDVDRRDEFKLNFKSIFKTYRVSCGE